MYHRPLCQRVLPQRTALRGLGGHRAFFGFPSSCIWTVPPLAMTLAAAAIGNESATDERVLPQKEAGQWTSTQLQIGSSERRSTCTVPSVPGYWSLPTKLA